MSETVKEVQVLAKECQLTGVQVYLDRAEVTREVDTNTLAGMCACVCVCERKREREDASLSLSPSLLSFFVSVSLCSCSALTLSPTPTPPLSWCHQTHCNTPCRLS